MSAELWAEFHPESGTRLTAVPQEDDDFGEFEGLTDPESPAKVAKDDELIPRLELHDVPSKTIRTQPTDLNQNKVPEVVFDSEESKLQQDDRECLSGRGPSPPQLHRYLNFEPFEAPLPPPSVLLAHCTSLLPRIPIAIKQILTSDHEELAPTQRSAIVDNLHFTKAMARVLAGRTLRWKRDVALAQSMKIGPASKSGGGMKLTGLDKTEQRREDQAAEDFLQVWQQHSGAFKALMVPVKTIITSFELPNVTAKIPIHAAKPTKGAVLAPKSCRLCGIKREERAWKVDVQVQDSFGEFWHDHWGHVECHDFWQLSLRHRASS